VCGAARFNVTWTNSAGEPRLSRKGVGSAEITRTMPAMLDAAIADRLNLFVRPYGRGVSFIQLDDLVWPASWPASRGSGSRSAPLFLPTPAIAAKSTASR
jgi:hypothetical protein